MAVIAKLNYLRIAPRKVRLVADLIRGKKVEEARNILNFTIKKANQPLIKLLKSAIANAENNFQLNKENLYISKITVDEGPKLKRWMPRARGSAAEIQKKTSHITIVLDEIEKRPKRLKRAPRPSRKAGVPVAEGDLGIEKAMPKAEKPKIRKPEIAVPKPKIERAIRKIFRRKAF